MFRLKVLFPSTPWAMIQQKVSVHHPEFENRYQDMCRQTNRIFLDLAFDETDPEILFSSLHAARKYFHL